MKKTLFMIIGLVIISFAFMTGCRFAQGDSGVSAYTLKGDVAVHAESYSADDSFAAKLFGDIEGVFTPRSMSSRNIMSRDSEMEFEYDEVFDCPDLLRKYDEDQTFASVHSYSFSSFKIVTDIFLIGDEWWEGQSGYISPKQEILRWGGDQNDLSNYVDLATGEFVSTETDTEVKKKVYKSIIMQLNAPAETIIPDFGDDVYDQVSFSWDVIKPFFSTNSNTQQIILSTYVEEPFARWLGGNTADFGNYTTVQEYNSSENTQYTGEIVTFQDWAFYAPLNEEFFDAVEGLEYEEDPLRGEAWLFLPMHEVIDVTGLSNVSFSFEFFMKDLFEVYIDSLDDPHYILSVGKTYTDQDGNKFYAPLPIKVTFFENEEGFSVVE